MLPRKRGCRWCVHQIDDVPKTKLKSIVITKCWKDYASGVTASCEVIASAYLASIAASFAY